MTTLMTADQRRLRNALGTFGTGVCLITANTDAGPIGLTVNSFASVSLDPPLVLWSLDRMSDRSDAFHIVDRFAVNILKKEHQELATQLARKGSHAVPDGVLREGWRGVPYVHDALASFMCGIEVRHDGGDHVIFVGRVEHFEHSEEGDPLLYYRGAYRSLAVT